MSTPNPIPSVSFADWKVEPRWNLCNAAGSDNGSKVYAVKARHFPPPGGPTSLFAWRMGKPKTKP